MSRHLPNAISVLRLGLLPLYVVLFLRPDRPGALLVLGLIAFSDALDGWLARRYAWTSRTGAIIDPLADKVVQVTALGLLAFRPPAPFTAVPAWLFGLVLARDLLLGYGTLRIRARRRKVVVRARIEGRLSTLLVFLILFAALLGAGSQLVLLASVAATPLVLAAAIRYAIEGRSQLSATA